MHEERAQQRLDEYLKLLAHDADWPAYVKKRRLSSGVIGAFFVDKDN